MFDSSDVVMKEWRPKIVSLDDFLGYAYIREVAAIGACVAIVEDVFDLCMSEATTEKGINPVLVEGVANKKVTMGLMVNVSLIIASEVGGEFLGVQIY